MGRKSRRTIKKIEKRVIKQLGVDVIYKRMFLSEDSTTRDPYGEPLNRDSDGLVDDDYDDLDERTVRIVVDSIKLEEIQTTIGGISNTKKEVLKCFISQSEDVKVGDQIFFPPNSNTVYEIRTIMPNYLQDENVVWEVHAMRDPTTKD